LGEAPKKPKTYVTGNNKNLIEQYKKGNNLRTDLYGVIGPIVGMTGLLIALAERKKIPAVCILAETYAFPMFLGISGAREMIKILSKRIDHKINLKKFDKEIKDLQEEMLKKTEEISKITKQPPTTLKVGETSYIG
ncbi:MAG: PAC2 family protein, partial [Candidatus Woesearchaeota archaeon]